MTEALPEPGPAGPPFGVDAPGRTGDAVVDEVLQQLDALPQAGLDDQVRVLAEAHEALQQRLSSSHR